MNVKKTANNLHVKKNNPAKHFYDRLGFKVAADREVYWFMEWQPNNSNNKPNIAH
ncbi:hypothetical protein KAR48_05375 [bacterium]|nr:hypothetical protein [bacterium]